MKWLGSKPAHVRLQAAQEQRRLAKAQTLHKAFPDKFAEPKKDEDHEHRRANQTIYWSTPQVPSTWHVGTIVAFPFNAAEERANRSAATPHEGIRAGEVVGWRSWLINRGCLLSVVSDHVWEPGPMEATQLQDGYGFFAYKNRPEASQSAIFELGVWGYVFAFGSIDMWGEIVEHEAGYRSTHAAIASIEYVSTHDAKLLGQLRAKYVGPPAQEAA